MNRLNELAIQSGLPVKTLAFIKCEGGEYKSPLWKFFTDAEKADIISTLNIEEGDIVFFVAGAWEMVSTVLGRTRLDVAGMMEINKNSTAFNFLWVVDFPLLAFSAEDNAWVAVHHPFTRPKAEDIPHLEAGDYAKVRAVAYDVVLNGYELGGGSIRIHEKDLQAKMFSVLGISAEEQQEKFSHLLDAFLAKHANAQVAAAFEQLVTGRVVCRKTDPVARRQAAHKRRGFKQAILFVHGQFGPGRIGRRCHRLHDQLFQPWLAVVAVTGNQ